MKNKKYLIGLIVVVVGIIGMFIDDDTTSNTVVTTDQQQQPKEKKTIDVTNLDISDTNYHNEIKSINKYIGDIKVDNDKITINFKDDMPILSEKNLVKSMAIDGIDIFKKTFENKNVNQVELIAKSKFINSNGKEEVKDAVNISWNKEINNNIDYSNYKDLLYSDYTKLYSIADSFNIHPSIWNKLDIEDKNNMSL